MPRMKNKVLKREDLIIQSLGKYYFNQENRINVIKSITEPNLADEDVSNKDISLRILEWFVTNYAKKYDVYWKKENNKDYFHVFMNYKSQLNAYSKKQFDPFCRGRKIEFIYNDNGDYIKTTVGQLNFFRWAINNNIVNYVRENRSEIETDMNESTRMNYQNAELVNCDKTNKSRKKRNEISRSATRKMNIHNYKVTLSFD
jgi:hypothetical protein